MQKGGSMKRARCQKFFIVPVLVTSLLLGVYGIRRFTHHVLTSAPITIRHSDLVHEAYAARFADEFTHNMQMCGPVTSIHNYKKRYPIVSSVAIRYTFPLHAIVDYAVVAPDVCLNNSVGLLPDGAIVPVDIFAPDFLATIPHIQVPSSLFFMQDLPVSLINCSKKISHNLLERFSCDWQNDYTCYYHDLQNPLFTLVYEGYEPPGIEDIALYDRAITQYKPGHKHTQWCVDLRFKNQVVISPDQGM